MARTNNLTDFLTDVSSAIKQKTGDNTPIPASEFDTEILSIETGGNYQSKTLNITQNGNYNLLPDQEFDAISNVNISVSVSPVLQNKTITENGSYTADQNYDGLGTVIVNVPSGEEINNQDKTITENGIYTADSGYTGLGTVTVNIDGVKLYGTETEMKADLSQPEDTIALVYTPFQSGITIPQITYTQKNRYNTDTFSFETTTTDGDIVTISQSSASSRITTFFIKLNGTVVLRIGNTSSNLNAMKVKLNTNDLAGKKILITNEMLEQIDCIAYYTNTTYVEGHFGGIYQFLGGEWAPATTELSEATASDVLKGVMVYGSGGIVTGDGSYLDNMPALDKLEMMWGADNVSEITSTSSKPIKTSVVTDLYKEGISINSESMNVVPLKFSENGLKAVKVSRDGLPNNSYKYGSKGNTAIFTSTTGEVTLVGEVNTTLTLPVVPLSTTYEHGVKFDYDNNYYITLPDRTNGILYFCKIDLDTGILTSLTTSISGTTGYKYEYNGDILIDYKHDKIFFTESTTDSGGQQYVFYTSLSAFDSIHTLHHTQDTSAKGSYLSTTGDYLIYEYQNGTMQDNLYMYNLDTLSLYKNFTYSWDVDSSSHGPVTMGASRSRFANGYVDYDGTNLRHNYSSMLFTLNTSTKVLTIGESGTADNLPDIIDETFNRVYNTTKAPVEYWDIPYTYLDTITGITPKAKYFGYYNYIQTTSLLDIPNKNLMLCDTDGAKVDVVFNYEISTLANCDAVAVPVVCTRSDITGVGALYVVKYLTTLDMQNAEVENGVLKEVEENA